MNHNLYNRLLITVLCIFSITCLSCLRNTGNGEKLHTWEMYEIKLLSDKEYSNSYTDVTCWVELEGPGFSKRIYGFWDGGKIFKIRVVATKPGKWHWQSSSNQPDDNGLNNKQGEFTATGWSEKELIALAQSFRFENYVKRERLEDILKGREK